MLIKKVGQAAEDKALAYLQQQGLVFVTKNFNCKFGELDLIMRSKTHLIIIEVRKRSTNSYGGGVESITFAKRQKIIKTTEFYLTKNNLSDKVSIRFDVVSIDGKEGVITWIKDAFRADY